MRRLLLLTFLAGLTVILAACSQPGPQMVFDAELTPEAENPPVTGTTAYGDATATLSDDESTLTVTGNFYELTGPATNAHVHGPAEEDENAGPVFQLQFDTSENGSISGTWDDITEAEVQDLRDGLYYINVHTDENPGGEIRGQLE